MEILGVFVETREETREIDGRRTADRMKVVRSIQSLTFNLRVRRSEEGGAESKSRSLLFLVVGK